MPKAFRIPFETSQRSVKIKLNLIFSLRPGLGREGLKCCYLSQKESEYRKLSECKAATLQLSLHEELLKFEGLMQILAV